MRGLLKALFLPMHFACDYGGLVRPIQTGLVLREAVIEDPRRKWQALIRELDHVAVSNPFGWRRSFHHSS
jgi:hypothetical protein